MIYKEAALKVPKLDISHTLKPGMRMIYDRTTSLGITFHGQNPTKADGWPPGKAITLQFRGRMMSIVFGDWWRRHG